MIRTKYLTLIFLMCITSLSLGQTPSSGLSVDVLAGLGKVDFNNHDSDTYSVKTSLIPLRLAIGYPFWELGSHSLSLEVGNTYLGNVPFKDPSTNRILFSYDISDQDLLLNYRYRVLPSFSIIAKAGMAYVEQIFHYRTQYELLNGFLDWKYELNPEISLGIQNQITPHLGLVASYNHVFGSHVNGISAYTPESGDASVANNHTAQYNTLMLGFNYQFDPPSTLPQNNLNVLNNLYFNADIGYLPEKQQTLESLMNEQAILVQKTGTPEHFSLGYLTPTPPWQFGAEFGAVAYPTIVLNAAAKSDQITQSASAKPLVFEVLFDTHYALTSHLYLTAKSGLALITYLNKDVLVASAPENSVQPKTHPAPEFDLGLGYIVNSALSVTGHYSLLLDSRPDVLNNPSLTDTFRLGSLGAYWLGIEYRL